ncbi:MAG: hypothetical protein LBB08_01740, partial [Rickettsiales bacterium]|nr:hypothetical protein [Rickettsiales bacterium]
MEKKKVLESAAAKVGQRRRRSWISRRARAVVDMIRGWDRLVCFNIALLFLLSAMLGVMLWNVKKNGSPCARIRIAGPESPAARGARKPPRESGAGAAPASSRLVRQADEEIIYLPLRQQPNSAKKQIRRVAAAKPVKRQKFGSDVVMDGSDSNVNLHGLADIRGNLYLQNMRAYRLPCGIRISGSLYLRNVGLLKFCDSEFGSFKIGGNIYVSS